MSMKTRYLAVIALALIGILVACAAEPEVIVETVVQEVEVEVTRVVTETIVEEGEAVEVTRVVVETETIIEEVEVTAVPEEEAPG